MGGSRPGGSLPCKGDIDMPEFMIYEIYKGAIIGNTGDATTNEETAKRMTDELNKKAKERNSTITYEYYEED